MDVGDLHGSICDMEFIYNVECGQVCLTIDAWMTHSKDAYQLDIKKYTLSLVFYLKFNQPNNLLYIRITGLINRAQS